MCRHKPRDEAGKDEITDGGVREETAGEAGAVEEGMDTGPGKLRDERRDARWTDEDTGYRRVVVVVMHGWRIQS